MGKKRAKEGSMEDILASLEAAKKARLKALDKIRKAEKALKDHERNIENRFQYILGEVAMNEYNLYSSAAMKEFLEKEEVKAQLRPRDVQALENYISLLEKRERQEAKTLESLEKGAEDIPENSTESPTRRTLCNDYEEAKDKKNKVLDMLRVISPLIGILAVICLLMWRMCV